jgi:hypothetical protein
MVNDVPKLKVGVVVGVIVTVKEVDMAHSPGLGVNI